MEEDGCEQEGAADEAVAEGRVLDDGIRPYRDPTEVNQEGNDVDLESPTDREKYVEEADENEGGAHDHPGDTHLVVAPGILFWLAALRLIGRFWRHGQLVPKRGFRGGLNLKMFAQGKTLALIRGSECHAIELAGVCEHPVVYNLEKGLSIMDQERHVVGSDL